jgi:tight adherence protein B
VVAVDAQMIVTAVLVSLAVMLGALSLALFWEWVSQARRRKAVSRRLENLGSEGMGAIGEAGASVLRREQSEGWTRALSTRLPHVRDIRILLEQAALDWTVQGYLVRSAGFSLALALGTLVLSGVWAVVLLMAFIGALLPYLHVRRKQRVRLDAFEEFLPEAVDLLGRAVRAGHPLSSGLRMVGDEAQEPVAGEFRRVFEEQRFGLAFDDAFLGMADRVPLVDVRIFATAVLIQREVGGNLAEILDKLSYVIRQRFTIQRQLNVYTAQGRLSGLILSLLPVGVGFVMFLLNPEYVLELFRNPFGRFMVGGAVVFQMIGYLWIRKIVNIEI